MYIQLINLWGFDPEINLEYFCDIHFTSIDKTSST